jgi:hypothetical protein
MIIRANICVSDIDKARIFTSEKTSKKYLSLTLMSYKEGPDRFENDGSVAHSVSQEERLAGEKGAFCGSWRWVVRPEGLAQAPAAPARPPAKPAVSGPPDDSDDIPF